MKELLFIEPDKILGDIFLRYFSSKNFNVRVTSSAQEAILLADEITPDIVIIELQLKQHNGIDFLYEFRSYSDWLEIPIVILSMVPANEFPNSKKFWNELNVYKYIYKPKLKLSSLLNEINEIQMNKTT
jgi:DNA-binding response OmpR family regulator